MCVGSLPPPPVTCPCYESRGLQVGLFLPPAPLRMGDNEGEYEEDRADEHKQNLLL